jgi:hypothetical protein
LGRKISCKELKNALWERVSTSKDFKQKYENFQNVGGSVFPTLRIIVILVCYVNCRIFENVKFRSNTLSILSFIY